MKKQLFLLLMLFIPIGMMAQLTHILEIDETTGLKWLQDYSTWDPEHPENNVKSGERYINVASGTNNITDPQGNVYGNSYFLKNGSLRPFIRNAVAANAGIPTTPSPKTLTESQIKALEYLNLTSVNIDNYADLKYLTGLKELQIKLNSANSASQKKKIYLSTLTQLTTLDFYRNSVGTSPFPAEKNYIVELDISNTQISNLNLTGYTFLEKLWIDNMPLPASMLNLSDKTRLKEFSAKNNTALSGTLDFSNCAALEKLNLSGATNLTGTLDLSGSRKIARIDLNGAAGITGLTLPADASSVTDLYIDVRGSGIEGQNPRYNLDLSGYPNLASIQVLGDVDYSGYTMNGVKEITIDLTGESNTTANVSYYPNLEKLTLIGVTGLTGLPSNSTKFTLDITESPDLPMSNIMAGLNAWTNLTELTFIDYDPSADQKDLDFHSLTSLEKLTIEGESESLIVPESLTSLTAKNTGLESLDLQAATGLVSLDLTDSDELVDMEMPTGAPATLNKLVLAGCKSLSEESWANFGHNYVNLTYIDISRTNHKGNAKRQNVVVGYNIKVDENNNRIIDPDNEDEIAAELNTVDLTHCPNLEYLDISATEVQYLDVHGLTNLKYLMLVPKRDYEGLLTFNNNSINEGKGLVKLDCSGCTNLKFIYFSVNEITNETIKNNPEAKVYKDYWDATESESRTYQQNSIKMIDAHGCTKLINLGCYNSPLTRLDVSGCTNLSWVSQQQGQMTTQAYERSGISACGNLVNFNCHRNLFDDINFITVPGTYGITAANPSGFVRTADDCARLKQLQVNGGSINYFENVHYIDEASKTLGYTLVQKALYTNRIKEIDLQYVTNLTHFFAADNLLRTLNFPDNWYYTLRQMEISNNRMTTLDMSKLNPFLLMGYEYNSNTGNYDRKGYSFQMKHQMTFRELDVIKGNHWIDETGHIVDVTGLSPHREDGENDLAVLYLPYGEDRSSITDLKLGDEDDDYYSTGEIYYETGGSDGVMDIIHITHEVTPGCIHGNRPDIYFMKTHDGAINASKDLDMHRKIMRYSCDTWLSKDKDGNDKMTATEYNRVQNDRGYEKDYILNEWPMLDVKIHIEPYVVYLNPQTRSPYDNIDYYSGTVCLSYEWEVPVGLEAYIVTGVREKGYLNADGTTQANSAFHMVKVGDAGDIIPKLLPVYLKSVPAYKGVVKADGTTPAKKWTLNNETKEWEETASDDPDGLSHAAGFYALHKNWDPDYLGWRNDKGYSHELNKLYINKHRKHNNIKQENWENPDGDPCCKPIYMDGEWKYLNSTEFEALLATNILECQSTLSTEPTDAMYYDTFNPDDKYHYSFTYQNTIDGKGIQWQVFSLGREQKAGTGYIGFWPYGGYSLSPHRCYIRKENVDIENIPDAADGMSFFFETITEPLPTDIKDSRTTIADKIDHSWYTISGARLQGEPTTPGVYIHEGKKVLIKK